MVQPTLPSTIHTGSLQLEAWASPLDLISLASGESEPFQRSAPGQAYSFRVSASRSRLDALQEPYSSSATRGSQRCLDTIPGVRFRSFHSSHHNPDSNTTSK